jgi:hypothetical protein
MTPILSSSFFFFLFRSCPSDPILHHTFSDMCAALTKNLANPAITDVYILSEVSFDLSFFPNMHKIHQRVIGKSSFKYFLRTANEIIGTFWFCLFGVYLFSCLVSDNF